METFDQVLAQMQLVSRSRRSLLRKQAQQLHQAQPQPQGQHRTHQNLAQPNQLRGPLAAELLKPKLQAVGHHLALVVLALLVTTPVVVVVVEP